MLDLYLIRHPQTPANLEKRVQGALVDEEPKPGYEARVEELADMLAHKGRVDAVLTSTLKRARIPTHLLFELLMQKGQTLDYVSTPILNERNWGEYNGKPYDQVPFGEEGLHQYLFALAQIEGGEGHEDIRRRLEEFDRWYVRNYIGKKGDEPTHLVVVGHQFLLAHMAYFYLKGNPVAGPYTDLQNLGVRHLRLESQQTGQKAVELPFLR